MGATFIVIECTCPEEIVRQRLEARLTHTGEPSDGRWELFHQQKAGFEPVDEVAPRQHLVIDCSGSPTESTDQTLRLLMATGRDSG